MRRTLLGIAAVELVVGAVVIASLPSNRPAASSRAMAGAAVGRATVHSATGAPAAVGAATPLVERRGTAAHARPVGDAARPDPARSARQASFKEPVDFATGALPSSDAFNRVEGDQLGPALAQMPLPDGLAVGDFDGDGAPDVAQTNVLAGTVSVFLADGRGGFEAPTIEPVGVNPIYVVAARLDRDDDVDLAVANFGSHTVTVLRGDGRGDFEPAATLAVPFPRNVAVANFDGDAVADLAVAFAGPAYGCPRECTASPLGGVAILMGTDIGNGLAFTPAQVIRPVHSGTGQPVGANYAATDDFDGNGLDDVAVSVGFRRNAGDVQADGTFTGDDVLIYLNQGGAGVFADKPSQPALRVSATPEAIAVADLNRDGNTDLAVVNNGNGEITTLLGSGEGHFTVTTGSVRTGGLQRSLAVADFNDDGIPDLVTASFHSSSVSVLEGKGNGSFHPAVDHWSDDAPTSVGVGDFDDDGRTDVVVARLRPDALALLVNDSPRRDDGVAITHSVPYVDPAGDPLAAHHNLDVYAPPPGSRSFAGRGRAYPVVIFAHGGFGVACDKTGANLAMRSLAREGIVAVSINYRMGFGIDAGRAEDFAAALRWTRDNIGASAYGGDPGNIVVFGYSGGAPAALALVAEPAYEEEQKSIRGIVFAGAALPVDKAPADLPPTLILNGDQGLENGLMPTSAAFTFHARRQGTSVRHMIIEGRDHLTLIARLARSDDEGRAALLGLIRGQ